MSAIREGRSFNWKDIEAESSWTEGAEAVWRIERTNFLDALDTVVLCNGPITQDTELSDVDGGDSSLKTEYRTDLPPLSSMVIMVLE